MDNETKKKFIVGLAFAVAVGILLFFSGCARTHDKQDCIWYDYFDTECSLITYNDYQEFEQAKALVEEQLAFYDELCDIYDSSDSYVNACELNASAGKGPVRVTRELFDILSFGKDMYTLTDGQCNIAFGAVLELWHEAREDALNGKTPYLPSEKKLQEAAEHCNIDDLILNEKNLTVELADPKMSIDLGAITKGYVTDMVIQSLTDAEYTGYILNLGGNVKANGEKYKNADWVTGIANPDTAGDSAYVQRVEITEESVVTSGSYQRYYEYDGQRYHHIISPETLGPKNDYLSVTILTESSAKADALSTAVFNMDYTQGLALIESLDGVEAAWIFPDMSMEYSSGFEAYLVESEDK